jgi:hypothetical protein
MKKTFVIENKKIVKDLKVRGTFAPKEKVVKSKKVYNRKKIKPVSY